MDIADILARIEYLTDALAILEGQDNDPNDEIEDKCIDLFTNLVDIKKSMDALRIVFGRMKEQHQIAMVSFKIILRADVEASTLLLVLLFYHHSGENHGTGEFEKTYKLYSRQSSKKYEFRSF